MKEEIKVVGKYDDGHSLTFNSTQFHQGSNYHYFFERYGNKRNNKELNDNELLEWDKDLLKNTLNPNDYIIILPFKKKLFENILFELGYQMIDIRDNEDFLEIRIDRY